MKTTARMFVVLVLLLAAMPVMAQYKVQPGDTLWGIAGQNMDSASAWEKIYEANPFLREPGRRFVDPSGRTIVVLRPGEELAGLNALGIVPERAELAESFSEQLPLIEEKAPLPVKETGLTWPPVLTWVLFFVLVVLFGFFFPWIRRRFQEERLNQNPVTSGPAFVQDGVTPEAAPEYFQEVAARRWAADTGRTATSNQMFTILNSVSGRGWGIMTVSYADGRNEPRRLNGERVYRADVRFPDGNVETLYMLQGCGNDLRYGGVNRYRPEDNFRFEADQPVQMATSEPVASVTEPTAVQVVPTVATEESSTPVAEDGVVKFELKRAHDELPTMIRMTGVDENADIMCEIRADGVLVRFTPRRA